MSTLMSRFATVVFIVAALLVLNSHDASAISGWKAGRIIDDSVFTAYKSMSPSQIQTFLNNKVPSCDTYGKQLSEFGGPDLNGDGKVQRWEWGKSRYNQTKFVCLKNWKTSGGTSAAQVIYNKAQKYRISPKVLIVLLQKEQSLVTDTWPLNVQYRTATGYGCPDTAPCDSQYYGLQNQLDWAAKMFRSIMDDSPGWYTPYEVGNNYIQYNPVQSCGGKTVNIENRATQALYNYTPYTPNKAALDAGWGSAHCGAYGNRNFFLYFKNWFGSPNTSATYGYSLVSQELYSDPGYTNKISDKSTSMDFRSSIYAKVVVRNTGNQVWDQSLLKIGTLSPRDRSSPFKDSSWLSYKRASYMDQISVAGGELATFKFKLTAPSKYGQYSESFGVVIEGQRWLSGSFSYSILTQDPVPVYSAEPVGTHASISPTGRLRMDTNNITTWSNNRFYVTVRVKNSGTRPLPADITKIGTSESRDRSSIFEGDDWLSNRRTATAEEGEILPGEIGTFKFSMKSPIDQLGSYTEKFGLVIDGERWVSEGNISLDINVKNRPEFKLDNSNTTLSTSGYLVSQDDRFYLTLQSDGNLVLYSALTGSPLWHSKTNNTSASRLRLQSDGNLVLYRTTPDRKALWHTRTFSTNASELRLQNDGNLVLYRYSPDRKALWHTRTYGAK